MLAHFKKGRLSASAAMVAAMAVCGYPEIASAQQDENAEVDELRVQPVIVVSARFKEETLDDIGITANVYGSDDLADLGVTDFEDIALLTPGLENLSRGPGNNLPTIRGVSTANRNLALLPQTALNTMFFDEVAVKTLTPLQPEIPTFDLSRVEVLKGPQPTYFGEGSMGGSIRFLSQDPSLTDYQVRTRTELSTTSGSDQGLNYIADASVSLPLVADKLGIRLSASLEERDGFIDAPAQNLSDVNDVESNSFTGVVLFEPTQNLTWRLSGFYSDLETAGAQSVSGTDPSDLNTALLQPDMADDETWVLANKISLDLGAVTLESVTGYLERDRTSFSVSPDQSALAQSFGFAGGVVQGDLRNTDENFSQEFRLLTDFEGPFNFVGGALYTDTKSTTFVDQRNTDPLFSTLVGTDLWIGANAVTNGEQLSFFGEGQLSLYDDRLRLAAGIRYFEQDFDLPLNPAIGEVPVVGVVIDNVIYGGLEKIEVSLEEWLPRFQFEYDATESLLIYGSYAEGARSGLYNAPSILVALGVLPGTPLFEPLSTFDTDTVQTTELGLKWQHPTADLSLNFAGYYTDWQDVQGQLELVPGAGTTPTGNLGDAEILGLDWQVSYAPTDTLSLAAGGTFQSAEFAEDIAINPLDASLIIPSGTDLPQTAEVSYFLSAEYRLPRIIESADLIAGANYTYTGERLNVLSSTSSTQDVEALDLVGARLALEGDSWTATVFAENLFNQIEATYIPSLAFDQQFINRPRTIGIALRKDF